jgi:hypothetical protein
MTLQEALQDANRRLEERGQKAADNLQEAVSILQILIGTDCECDNTHQSNGTKCCLCWYQDVLSQPKINL